MPNNWQKGLQSKNMSGAFCISNLHRYISSHSQLNRSFHPWLQPPWLRHGWSARGPESEDMHARHLLLHRVPKSKSWGCWGHLLEFLNILTVVCLTFPNHKSNDNQPPSLAAIVAKLLGSRNMKPSGWKGAELKQFQAFRPKFICWKCMETQLFSSHEKFFKERVVVSATSWPRWCHLAQRASSHLTQTSQTRWSTNKARCEGMSRVLAFTNSFQQILLHWDIRNLGKLNG